MRHAPTSGVMPLFLIAIAAPTTHCARTTPSQEMKPMDQASNDAATLRALYERDANALFQKGWTLSWWRHGGEPGPDWLSDKLDLVATGGTVTARYVRARNAQTPPFKSTADEISGALPADLSRRLFNAVFSSRLYERTLPSEGRASLADAMIQTFEMTAGEARLAKTLYEPAPEELGDLWSACDATAAYLVQSGVHRDVTPQ